MKKEKVGILLFVGILGLLFLNFRFDRVLVSDTVKIENVVVKNTELGYVKLQDNNFDYNINFNQLGDEFVFSFDINNDTNFDMNISKIKVTGVNDWVTYKVFDNDRTDLNKGFIMKKGMVKTIYISLRYDKEIESDYADCQLGIDLKVTRY